MENLLMQCYNRGCGEKYDPHDNNDDSCCHHPGQPVFHDAYKGWSCCNKKCTDFTEFLNIKGCTLSKHSNIKPSEPEKPKPQEVPDIIEVPKPIVTERLKRPPLDTLLVTLKPQISQSFQQTPIERVTKPELSGAGEIEIGTLCKNGGCSKAYEGPETNENTCRYHPGVPIFHEGLKYWSCCQKKTTDFNTFLSQAGCNEGSHVWKKEESDKMNVQCRWDFHQTGSFVVVSIYAKQYCPKGTVVKLSPVRLYTKLLFPQQSDASFVLDVELGGIITVEASQVTYFGTKVEIKMKKAELLSWSKVGRIIESKERHESEKKSTGATESIVDQVEAVELNDL